MSTVNLRSFLPNRPKPSLQRDFFHTLGDGTIPRLSVQKFLSRLERRPLVDRLAAFLAFYRLVRDHDSNTDTAAAAAQSDEIHIPLRPFPVLDERPRFTGEQIRFARASNLTTDTEMLVAKNGYNDIVIAFRGSEGPGDRGFIKDWLLADARVGKARFRRRTHSDQKVHRGFQLAYAAIADRLHEILDEWLDPSDLQGFQPHLFFTGFSLGGALALIAALDLACTSRFADLPKTVRVFGTPRAMNEACARLFNSRVPNARLYVRNNDPIPVLPIYPSGYRHPGTVFLREDSKWKARSGLTFRDRDLLVGGHKERKYRELILGAQAAGFDLDGPP